MVRTSVYIDEADKRSLELEAQRTGRSEAELIRLSVKQLLKPTGKQELPSFVGAIAVGGDASKEKQPLRKGWHQQLERKLDAN